MGHIDGGEVVRLLRASIVVQVLLELNSFSFLKGGLFLLSGVSGHQPLVEDSQPRWLGIDAQSDEKDERDHYVLDSKDGEDRSGGVFSEVLEPWEHIVDLIGGVAAENDICENAAESEDVKRVFPGSDVMCLARERSPRSALKLEHIGLRLQVDEDRRDSCSKGEGSCEEGNITERHNHLEVVVKLLDFFFLKFCKFLFNDCFEQLFFRLPLLCGTVSVVST